MFRGPARPTFRLALVAAWLTLAVLALGGLVRADWLTPFVFALAGLGFAGVWSRVVPRADRPWADDVARVFHVEQTGDRVRIDNVRDFVWRTRADYTPCWVSREYDLDQLVALDLVVSYWAGRHIAHAMVSFAFADGRHLCFSVEVRRIAGGHFSALGGLFRQCELVVIAAEERDIVYTRSHVRGERVFLYRVAMPDDEIRRLFRAYLKTGQALAERPRFYNTLTANCTTLIYDMVRPIVPGVPWNWRLLVSGHLPNYLYRLAALDTRLSLAELTERGRIDGHALSYDREDASETRDFSSLIRAGLPDPERDTT